MAANQGIYNAFLVAGLVWSLLIKERKWQVNVATCFLLFVAVAGVFAAATVTPKTLMIQTAPAVLALVILFFSRNSFRRSKKNRKCSTLTFLSVRASSPVCRLLPVELLRLGKLVNGVTVAMKTYRQPLVLGLVVLRSVL